LSIIVDEKTRVIVQGITGREGRVRTRLMKEYGTNILGGVTPGKGGMEVEGLPVFDTISELVDKIGIPDASCIFVPAPLVKDAALEAIFNGIKFLLIVPDKVPIHDVLTISAYAKKFGASFVGPNTLGVLSPDKAVLGMIGGRAKTAKEWFKKGPVGVTSRSGGITSAISYYLTLNGMGESTIVHIGGDAVIGLTHPEIIKMFEIDPETQVIAMFGEIGTTQEERVAELVKSGEITKPIVAYIGGKGARKGTRFSHAGAIVEGNRGSRESKIEALQDAGIRVVEDFMDIPEAVKEVLK